MKTSFLKVPLIALFFGILLFACDDSEKDIISEPLIVSSVAFKVESQNIEMTDGPTPIQLELDQKAVKNGHVMVGLSGDGEYEQDFTTAPPAVNGTIAIEILKDAQFAEFTVYRSAIAGEVDKTLNLTLKDPTDGFKLGTRILSTIKLKKKVVEPTTASISFSEVFVHISENEPQGFEIVLNISGSVAHSELAIIKIEVPEGVEYGTHYRTEPATVLGELRLEILPGHERVSFKVLPVNNNLVSDNYELIFKITATSGDLHAGTNTSVTVRVEEDDQLQEERHSIADLRNFFNQYNGDFWLPNNYYIVGVITTANNVADQKTAYIQDETGGIMLHFTSNKQLNIGDHVQLNLKGATGTYVNSQKCITGITDILGIKLAENVYVFPEIVTFQQLLSGQFEGKKVRLENVQISEADGIKKFEGMHTVTNGTFSAYIRTYPAAPFSQDILPSGTLSITGIIGDWGQIQPQQYNHDITR